jgi:4-hydroxy-tetrahydrodipicolinate synthase
MQFKPLKGVFTALITPMNTRGDVDFAELAQLVNQQIKAGIAGLVPAGTTGESPTLDMQEHLDVIRCVVETAQGRVPVIAGTGANATTEAIHLTVEADRIGVDGFLHVAPYYNKPTQEGLFQHFAAIAQKTQKPIVLYSIPGRCGIEIGVETVARLFEAYPHIHAIKEAGGNADRVSQLRQACGSELTILSGDDALTLPFMSLGATGVISVASNLIPTEMVQMVDCALNGDYAQARVLHDQWYTLFKTLFIESNPGPAKEAMQQMGLIRAGTVRLPLASCVERTRAELARVLQSLNLIR